MRITSETTSRGRWTHIQRWALFLIVTPLSLLGLITIMLVETFLVQPRVPPPAAIPVACEVQSNPQPNTAAELYLDLLKKNLTRAQEADSYERHFLRRPSWAPASVYSAIARTLQTRGFELVVLKTPEVDAYVNDSYFNLRRLEDGETMVGLKQLDNVQFCVTDVLARKIPGDLIETGAWRGGVTIFMRAILKAYGDHSRRVWVADSFEGLPNFDRTLNPGGWEPGMMAVSLEEVQVNFARYGLLDDHVVFLKGFFNKTLPGAPITQLAVLRSDADLYESTRDVLNNLYPKLSVGGYAIFDDYGAPGCGRAIREYRASHGITEPMQGIDRLAVYWRREK
jgi:O-methyltransferase